MIGSHYIPNQPCFPWEIKSWDEKKIKKLVKGERNEWLNHH